MAFLDSWENALSQSYVDFAEIGANSRDIDITYGLAASALLWPVREALIDDEGYDALFDLCGPKANQIIKAMRLWEDDPAAAAEGLATDVQTNDGLQAALDLLLEHFQPVQPFTEQLAKSLIVRQGGGDHQTITNQIEAALVNIGGITTIHSLHLNLTTTVEIPPPPPPAKPPELVEFIGRQRELNTYLAQLGQDHLVVISGMAGVGKTALAAALVQQAAPSNKIFWHPFHAREGIDTVIWQLASFLAWHGQDSLWNMFHTTQQTGGQAQPAENLFEYVIELLRGRNYFLVLDDFQFVDDDPRLGKLMQRLQEVVSNGELSLILTSRRVPSFIEQASFAGLTGLTHTDTQELLLRQGIEISEPLVEQLHTATAGNAQLVRLASNALQERSNAESFINNLAEADNVERYLLNEVDEHLSGVERELMGTLSILLGYPATAAVVETLFDSGRVRSLLRRLADRHLLIVSEGADDREYLQHSIIQAFYDDHFGRKKRQMLHLRAADFYESEEPDLLKTTLHAERGGDVGRAAILVTEKTRAFINLGHARSIQELINCFKKASFEAIMWGKIHLAKGRINALLGERDMAKASYLLALEELEQGQDHQEKISTRAKILLSLGELLENEDAEEALKWLNLGLEDEVDLQAEEKAVMHIQIGTIQLNQAAYAEALTSLNTGLGYLSPSSEQLQGRALMNLGGIYMLQGEIEQSRKYNQKALEISHRLNDHFLTAQILTNLGISEFIAGEWDAGIKYIKNAIEQSKQLGDEQSRATMLMNLGAAYIYKGDDESAVRSLSDCIELALKNQEKATLLSAHFRLADLYIRQEKWTEVESHLEKTEEFSSEFGREKRPDIDRAWGEMFLGLKKIEHAKANLLKGIELSQGEDNKFNEGCCLRLLGQAEVAEKRFETAELHFESSVSLLEQIDPFETARTKFEWGKALYQSNRYDEGQLLITEAKEAFQNLGADRELVQIQRLEEEYEKGKFT